MAGNEKKIVSVLVNNKDALQLRHLGQVNEISTPTQTDFRELRSDNDIDLFLKPDSSKKKADIFRAPQQMFRPLLFR